MAHGRMLDKIFDKMGEDKAAPGNIQIETEDGKPQDITPGVIAGGRLGGLYQVKPVPNNTQLLVKLPQVLRDEVKATAKKAGLSTNQWVLNLLIEAVRPQKENA